MTRAERERERKIRDFWDDFAVDFIAMQEESQLPLPQVVADFMVTKGILPTDKLLDLGGGAGRFIPGFAPLTKRLIELDISRVMLAHGREIAAKGNYQQVRFMQKPWSRIKTRANQATVVFASMFDGLSTVQDIEAMTRLAGKWAILGHFTKRQSKLDQLVAAKIHLSEEITNYNEDSQQFWKNALTELGLDFKVQKFDFETHEDVPIRGLKMDLGTRVLFTQRPNLSEVIDTLYDHAETLEDTISYTYELIYWRTDQ